MYFKFDEHFTEVMLSFKHKEIWNYVELNKELTNITGKFLLLNLH